jgi:3-oxoacyl-[acyl-carrier protein] reductase
MTGDEPPTAPVVAVTGGSRGLGAALCRALVEQGYRVGTASRRPSEETERMSAEHPESFHWWAADFSDAAAVRPWISSVVDQFDGLDVLINNAGVLRQELFISATQADITDTIAVNLTGPLLLAQAAARHMDRRGGGTILNISSINAVRGHRGVASYSAAKAGLDGLTRALARELGPTGIRVNSLVPGYFESDMTNAVTDKNRDRIAGRTPLGRFGAIGDIVSAARFLISPDAGFITGQTLVIDGGLTC